MAEQLSIDALVGQMAKKAKIASRDLAKRPSSIKDKALLVIADRLEAEWESIALANAEDVARAGDSGLSKAMIDRLTLTKQRVAAMAKGLREIASLPDPVGEVTGMTTRPNGLQVGRIRVPLGVVGIVYESRPNITVDATALCIKSGNAVLLRGGSEALHSNRKLIEVVAHGLAESGLPEDCAQLVPTVDREAVTALVRQKGLVDLVIARGSSEMIHALSKSATVPLVEHGGGVCHVYIHESADVDKAITIAVNAKVNRPAVCNSAETFLVDRAVAPRVLPPLCDQLAACGVEVRGCPETLREVPGHKAATEEDWSTEYNDLVVSIKVVGGLAEAIEHINTYSTHHSDAIVAQDYSAVRRFMAEVDSAAVFANASTRFTDGNEFGLGAEIGISTQKLHARGPMGLIELTSYKFIVYGDGHIRQ